MGVSVEVKGGWRINTFLFLLTGSQAVVLPWAPVILKATNLSAQNVGIVMCVITLVGSVGVHGCLAAMKRTHSGAARRLTLLVLTLVGSVLYTISVLLLPTLAGGNTCPASTSASSVISKPHLPPDVDSEFSWNVTNSLLDGVTSPPSEIKINTTAKENARPSSTTTSNLSENSSFSSNAPKETEKGSTSLPSPKPSTNDQGKISASILTTTLTKSESTSTTIGSPTQSGKTTLNIAGAHNATTLPVPHEAEKPKDQAQSEITTKVESSLEKTTGLKHFQSDTSMIHKGTLSQKPDASKVSQTSFHSFHNGDQTQNSAENINDTSSSSSEDLFYYYDEDEEEPNSKAKHSAESYKQNHSFTARKTQHNYKTHENSLVGQQPEMPPVVAVKENNRLANMGGSFGDYAEGLPLERINNRDEWSNAFVKPELTNKVEASRTLHLPRQQASRLHSAQYRDHENGRYHDPHSRNGYHLQSHPLPRTHRKSSGTFDDQYERRRKRSVNPSQMTTGAENGKTENSGTFTDTGDAESRNATSVDKAYIRSLAINIESPVGIQTGVAILLILGTLASAGIETGVAQLWHCHSHGYDEGGVSQDILHRTITHTFQFSFYAAHKTWAGLTSGAWVIGGGTIAGLLCLMGVDSGVYSILGGMQLALGLCAVILILVIPVPYGSVDPPKTRRPLSLYLDDEVLREGVRRLAFHIWILANGCVAALSLTFGLWLILEVTGEQGPAIAAQTGAVSVSLASESLTLCFQKWLMARVGLQGVMGISGLALMTHLTLMWVCGNVVLVVISFAGLGVCFALLWVSVRHNALLLATVSDQERESWASWWCWRVGVGAGAIVWGSCVDARTSLSLLFKPAAFIAASIAFVVAAAAVMTRSQGKTRRRIYHTLDLDMAADDEEDDEEEANEDDWLVKRAKKEGINL